MSSLQSAVAPSHHVHVLGPQSSMSGARYVRRRRQLPRGVRACQMDSISNSAAEALQSRTQSIFCANAAMHLASFCEHGCSTGQVTWKTAARQSVESLWQQECIRFEESWALQKRSRAQHAAAALDPSRTKSSQSRAKPGRRQTRRWAKAVGGPTKPRNKTRGKKSAEPAPPAGPQRPEDQPAQPAEAPREADKLDSVFQDATRDSAAQILKLSVFQELDENEEPHMHAAMQVSEPIWHPDCSGPCARSMEFLSTWKTATGPTGALRRTWRRRWRASRTSTPARGLARARGGAPQRHPQRSGPLSHGQFVDYIVANKVSDKSILYSHLEQRTSDKIEPVREFFFRHFKDILTPLATVGDPRVHGKLEETEDVSLRIGARRGARQVRL